MKGENHMVIIVLLSMMIVAAVNDCLKRDAVGQEAAPTWPVTLAWNPNTEEDLDHYTLYTNGVAGPEIPAGTETIELSLEAGRYEWQLTASDWSGNESGLSEKVMRIFDGEPPADPAAPTVINIAGPVIINIGPEVQ